MATPHLLGLPYEVLELILKRYLDGLEISVRYPSWRINTQNIQNGATLLLICKLINNVTKPILFELVTIGHHALQLLRKPSDPFSLVLAPAYLPMEKFLHVCFDFQYALNLTKFDELWPWSNMRSLKLVDYQSPNQNITIHDFLQKFEVLARVQEICEMRKIHFRACLPLGGKQGVRLSLVNFLSATTSRPPLHAGSQPVKTILRLPEMNVIPLASRGVILHAVDNITSERVEAITRWFRDTAQFDCSYDHGLD